MQNSLFDTDEFIIKRILYEYLIIISPSYEIRQLVKKYKETVKSLIGDFGKNFFATAHITLGNALYHIEQDQLIKDTVLEISKNMHSFNVHLNGFNFFEHGETKNTLYISILDYNTINKICFTISKKLKLPTRRVPHITIAKGISRDKFSIAWNHFGKLNFESEFQCDRITVLKKKIVNKVADKYEILFESPLLKN